MSVTESNHTINAGVRRVLTRHWVDLEKTNFHSFRGVVRISGELQSINSKSITPLDSGRMQVLESEMMRLNGVTRIHFDLKNWRKSMAGQWELVNGGKAERANLVSRPGEGACQVRTGRGLGAQETKEGQQARIKDKRLEVVPEP
jgi:hypothetical protein